MTATRSTATPPTSDLWCTGGMAATCSEGMREVRPHFRRWGRAARRVTQRDRDDRHQHSDQRGYEQQREHPGLDGGGGHDDVFFHGW